MYDRFERDFEHRGLYVSQEVLLERPDFIRLQQEIGEAYASLPLEGCTTGYDVLAERYCIVPPKGKVFKLSGKFTKYLEGRYIEDYYASPEALKYYVSG